MNRPHLIWMTLPPGEAPGRGERISEIAAERGLVPDGAFALLHEGGDSFMTRETAPSMAEAYAAFDGRADRGGMGWVARTEDAWFGEASIVFCSVSAGGRRGVVIRFMEKEFRDLEIGMTKGGVLELIAAVREVCGAREVVWTRDHDVTSILEILDCEPYEIPVGCLDDVIAVAEVKEGLFERMEICGNETWAGGLRFAAMAWAWSE